MVVLLTPASAAISSTLAAPKPSLMKTDLAASSRLSRIWSASSWVGRPADRGLPAAASREAPSGARTAIGLDIGECLMTDTGRQYTHVPWGAPLTAPLGSEVSVAGLKR